MRACDRGCHSRSLPLPIDPPYDQGGHMQTLASVTPISALLETLGVGEPLSHGALTVIPLLAPKEVEPDWLTLAEAGAAVTITEVSADGEVPTLSLVNDTDRPVLLLDGEELIGAKQNRILNTTVLVAAHAALRIPLSCVEPGRWSYRDRKSTRLNSSHLVISYAVFCLKKKKNNPIH